MSELLQGFDRSTQITAFAHWHAPPPYGQGVDATDPDHTTEAWLAPDAFVRHRAECGV